jgi:hypothetical protein
MKDLTQYKNDLFSDRGTDVTKALTFAYSQIGSLPIRHHQLAAMTALMVVVNTMCNASKLGDEVELATLAREILDTAELDDASEDGVITVNPDLLFQYYVMRGVTAEQGESK